MCRLFSLILLSLVMLSGCTTRLAQLQSYPKVGDGFEASLARLYADFAESEAEQYDWSSSHHFARKGLHAIMGDIVLPEELDRWDLPKDALPTLTQARELLIKALADQRLKDRASHDKARALFLFDCWVEQQEEVWQKEHIALCREEFYEVVDGLYVLAEGGPAAAFILPKEEARSVIAKRQHVYFPFDSALLTSDARAIIKTVAQAIADKKDASITLNGFTDPLGPLDYNLTLSKKRALAVKNALVKDGLVKESVSVYGFGPYDKASVAPKGMPRDKMRTVEIVIDQ